MAATCLCCSASAQDWSLELSSSVELRTLKLTNKAEKTSRPLGGASIALYQGAAIIKQTQSEANGDFVINVPGNGDFILVVSYQDCNPKRFSVSTKVPSKFNTENWRPTFSIEGVIMARPLYSIDYSALKQPLARIQFMNDSKKIDDDEDYTDQILGALKKIKDAEDDLIDRFITATRNGDAALKKPDCPLAKSMYEKALSLIPGEEYPTEQLKKVGDCLKQSELAAQQAAAEQAALAAQKEQQRKADEAEAARKLAEKEREKKAEEEKAAAERIAKAAEKEKEKKAAEEKAEAERVAKVAEKERDKKAADEKAAAEQAAKAAERERSEKIAAEKVAAEKAEKEKKRAQQEADDKRKAETDRAEVAAKNERMKREEAERQAREAQQSAAVAESGKKKSEGSQGEAHAPQKTGGEEDGAAKRRSSSDNTPTATKPAAGVSGEKPGIRAFEPEEREHGGHMKKRDTRRSIPVVLGADPYKEAIKKADGYMKMKRYAEARDAYKDALKAREGDSYATEKLAEIDKALQEK